MNNLTDAQQVIARNMSETQLQELVEDLFRQTGWLVYHSWKSHHSEPGFPDLVMVHPQKARVIFAELKREGQKLSTKRRMTKGSRKKPPRELPSQEDWFNALDAIRLRQSSALGPCVEVYLWRPSDWLNDNILYVEGSKYGR